MVIPEAPPPKLRIDLAATGWAACFAIWFIAFTAIALFGDGSPIAYAALFGLFTAGMMLAVLALVVLPLVRRTKPTDDG